MAYRPRPGDTDSKRNLISNIHARGVPVADAAPSIPGAGIAAATDEVERGWVKEELSSALETRG